MPADLEQSNALDMSEFAQVTVKVQGLLGPDCMLTLMGITQLS